MRGPSDSRRKTYCPPALGYIAASSPYARAPSKVITPVTTHAMSSRQGEGSDLAMSAETMKIPEPIIDPATSMVASVNVMAFTKPECSACALGAVVSAATVLINYPQRRGKERVAGGRDEPGRSDAGLPRKMYPRAAIPHPVSYTHLTLPT